MFAGRLLHNVKLPLPVIVLATAAMQVLREALYCVLFASFADLCKMYLRAHALSQRHTMGFYITS